MIETVRRFIRLAVIPAYLFAYFAGLLTQGRWGLVLHFALLFVGMWSFVRRWLPIGAYTLAAIFMLFYFLLYWTDIFSVLASGLGLANKWMLYGVIYTLLVLGFGVQFIIRNRHSRYHVWRTVSLMSVQLFLAFTLPVLMPVLDQPAYYFSYLWPLKIDYFYPSVILKYPLPFVFYSFLGSLILAPALALILGKRFYCSWVCGCGGLAETFGDRWRHLSDKSTEAWKFEKVAIHTVLVIAVLGTAIVILSWTLHDDLSRHAPWLSGAAVRFEKIYGFVVGSVLAGVVGVGVYPTLGPRVWCRYFCPMAALLGLIQKAGRFRIRVKPDMCISCGNCSTYCEMGIDVRAYAQRNESFTRASCVGCGMCSHVCPRGVLRLENRSR
ncbi:MAG: 4Fe-4S binding protein [Acidobacteriota bacterium]